MTLRTSLLREARRSHLVRLARYLGVVRPERIHHRATLIEIVAAALGARR